MEQAPVTEMLPAQYPKEKPAKPSLGVYIFAKPGAYYLAYAVDAGQKISLRLPGNKAYKVDLIDTWNMKIVEQPEAAPGEFTYTAKAPFMAVRITKP
jgi:hypothetical protein